MEIQWRSVGVWRPGKEVKSAPLVLIFSEKIFRMVDPKQILVILKSDKQRSSVQFHLVHTRTEQNTLLHKRITNSVLLSDL